MLIDWTSERRQEGRDEEWYRSRKKDWYRLSEMVMPRRAAVKVGDAKDDIVGEKGKEGEVPFAGDAEWRERD
jgi:hypothetical protein